MKEIKSADSEKRRRSCERHLEQWRASGLSQAEYCRKHGLSVKTFGYRKRTIGKSALCLVEVPLPAPVCTAQKPISLAVGPRYTIKIEAGFDADTLRQFLEVLDRLGDLPKFPYRQCRMGGAQRNPSSGNFDSGNRLMTLPEHTRVYLALGSIDMRKAINGLWIVVEGTLSLGK